MVSSRCWCLGVDHKIDVVKLYLARNPLLASKYFQNSYGVLMLPLALCFESNSPSARKTEALELLLAACNNALECKSSTGTPLLATAIFSRQFEFAELLLSRCPASGLGESVLAVAASMLHFLVQALPPPPESLVLQLIPAYDISYLNRQTVVCLASLPWLVCVPTWND